MVNITHFLNGTKTRPPVNWEAMGLELNFSRDNEGTVVTITDWDWVIENAATINAWREAGRTGAGPGVFEGIPYRVELEEDGNTAVVFNGYIDLTKSARFSCERVTVTAQERQKIDWMDDRADGFTFEYLFEELKIITQSDFLLQPYVISTVPNYTELMLALLTTFIVTKELLDSAHQLTAISVEATNPMELSALVRAGLLILYIIATLATLVALITQLIGYLIQPVKYHACMTIKRHFEVGAQHLGFTFKSSIFESDPWAMACLMPEKLSLFQGNENGILRLGSISTADPLRGYFNGTFGDFCRAMEIVFNARCDVNDDGELLFERRDFNPSSPNFVITDIENFWHEINAEDFCSNFLLKFQTDISERNTIQEYDGTSYQVTIRPIIINNEDLVLTSGQKAKAFPFALAKRKTTLTAVEEVVKTFLDVCSTLMNGLINIANALISLYNEVAGLINDLVDGLEFFGIDITFELETVPPIKPVNFGAIIDNRRGMMKLHADSFNTAKLFIMRQGSRPELNKIHEDNATIVSAKNMWESFHFIDSFVSSEENPFGNQKIIKELQKVPFCFEDYLKVKRNNKITDTKGNTGRLISCEWYPAMGWAKIKYYINEVYTTNLREIYYEPTGK